MGARAVQSVVTEREAIAFEIAEIVGDVADVRGYLFYDLFTLFLDDVSNFITFSHRMISLF